VTEKQNDSIGTCTPLIPGGAPIQAEVIYAGRREPAASIEDVVSRRLGLQYFSWRDSIHAAPVVGPLMAEELHWPEAQAQEAISQYVE